MRPRHYKWIATAMRALPNPASINRCVRQCGAGNPARDSNHEDCSLQLTNRRDPLCYPAHFGGDRWPALLSGRSLCTAIIFLGEYFLSSAIQREPDSTAKRPSTALWTREPSLREAILLWALCGLIFASVASLFRPYLSLAQEFGDTQAYMQIAQAIRSWNFSGLFVKHFWGLPYAVAALAKPTGLATEAALLIVCAASSLAALVLAYRLWGGWIALFFSLLNFDWLQRSFLGGSEPLFVALVFASFLAIRKSSWKWAALLASLATITRPLGVLLLVGIGITLILRRQWPQLISTIAIAAAVAFLYVTPLRLYLHDPLATVHSYGVLQPNPYPPLFGIPFRAIVVGTLRYPAPLSNLVLSFSWILLVLAGNIAMLSTQAFHDYARQHPTETIFASLYLVSLYAYNLPVFARSNFARFAIPVLPFIFLALWRWLPKDRRVLWTLTVVTPVLAAVSAVGLKNVIAALHGH